MAAKSKNLLDYINQLQIGKNTITVKAKGTGVYTTSGKSASVDYYVYSITTTSSTHCTVSGATRIGAGQSGVALTAVADDGYVLPDSITVTGCSYSWDKATGQIILNNPTANVNVVVTAEQESAPMPVKGQIITMTLGNATPAAGTNNQYRVLSTSGTQAEVVAMFDASVSQAFGSNNTYNGSSLDTYLNTTWYGTLNSTAKSAIVSKTITQYQYASGSYDANTHASYADYSTKSVKASGLTRNIYALDVEDIENYFNHTFSTADIWEMFWNVRSQPSNYTNPWLRSANSDYSFDAFYVYGNFGFVSLDFADIDYAARPAFTIDLSKISWS